MPALDRRRFLQTTAAAAALGSASLSQSGCGKTDADFESAWPSSVDRVWLGPDYWTNPLQDWRCANRRAELMLPAEDRQVHLLTREVRSGEGLLTASVRVARLGGVALEQGPGSFGFRLGNRGPLPDYRNALVHGEGLDIGLTAEGGLFIGDFKTAQPGQVDLDRDQVELRIAADSTTARAAVTIGAYEPGGTTPLAQISREDLPPDALAGGVALIANFSDRRGGGGPPGSESENAGLFGFADWTLAGDLLEAYPERVFGPIGFAQYTLSRGILKLTAQMTPVDVTDGRKVALEIDGKRFGEAEIDPHAYTATFRVPDWDATKDHAYRLVYEFDREEHAFEGRVRRDPVDKDVLTVADISCNAHYAFPNTQCVASVAKLDPDVMTFTGDQYYEGTGGYGALRGVVGGRAALDMLRKWYQHGWTWRELIKDRPSLSIPDDHDVYHGNIWGKGGEAMGETQETGGYLMEPAFVNAVHRTQTSHHPDLPDPAPCKRGISVYFGDMLYGRVSFAIVADRQFKTAPQGVAPPTGGRADHVTDPGFRPETADLPGLDLLGERQMRFLDHWSTDWAGADMKAVVSQTIFTAMATHHGREHMRLIADYDTNGWPQTARNNALKSIRKAFAFHLAGDQHLPAVVRYGIDAPNDGPVAFASPAVNNLYPRWWEPASEGANRAEGAPPELGEHKDSFGHPLTVLAVENPELEINAPDVLGLETQKAAGFGVVRFDKKKRTVTVECWPLLADPTQPGTQFRDWPVTVGQLDNYGAEVVGLLPRLVVSGAQGPVVVQVIDEQAGETVYMIRTPEAEWRPPVFAKGKYTVKVSEPERGAAAQAEGLEPAPDNPASVELALG